MSKQTRTLVTGAGGFIGHHLVSYLKARGNWVRAVDIKYPEYAPSDADEFEILDLTGRENSMAATREIDEVYALAADMGGMGYIAFNHATILRDNALINIHTLEAARLNGVRRYFYTSSACFVPGTLVTTRQGPLPIENVLIGEDVVTHTGAYRRVQDRSVAYYKGDLIVIQLPGLPPIECTPEHQFLTPEGRWKQAADLTTTDRLVVPIPRKEKANDVVNLPLPKANEDYLTFMVAQPANISEYSRNTFLPYHIIGRWQRRVGVLPRNLDPVLKSRVSLDERFGELVGLFLAEGWVESPIQSGGRRRVTFSFGNESYLIKRTIQLLNRTLDIPESKIRVHQMSGQKGAKIQVVSEVLADFLARHCYDASGIKRARTKALSSTLLDSNDEFLRGLVKGFWLGDGAIREDFSRTRIWFSSTSKSLIWQVRAILLSLGIYTSLQTRTPSLSKIKRREIRGGESYHLYPVGKESVSSAYVLLFGETKSIRCNRFVHREANHFTVKIGAISRRWYEGIVYNLEVDQDHSYTVLNVAAHNCVYPDYLQRETNVTPLKEEDAYPADPQDAYGWEKLVTEKLCEYYRDQFGMETRIVRFHNIFGPCYDEHTEVMTRDGFKFFREISYQDEIATLNPETGCMEYHKPDAIQRYPYTGMMHKIKTRTIDMLITPDHSVYYTSQTSGKQRLKPFRLGKIKDIWDKSVVYFSRKAEWVGVDREFMELPLVEYSDGRSMSNRSGSVQCIPMNDWLEFLGWYIAEGSCVQTPTNYRVTITQYDKEKQQEIAQVIRKIGFHPYVYENNVMVNSKHLYRAVEPLGKAAEKHIPRELLNLPKDRLQSLFTTLMKGDGTKSRSRYSTVSKQLAEDVLELVIKLGYGGQIRFEPDRRGHYTGIYRVDFSRRTTHKAYKSQRSLEPYSGMVYDVTVPNHVLMVRRNGKTMLSGNCGTWDGGREKAPAAMCRKVAYAKLTGNPEVEIWGDGEQTRSFCYIDDCVQGIYKLMRSEYHKPLNLGQDRLVTINQLADMVAEIAGTRIVKKHIPGPQGVRGRNSDNTRLREVLDWEPEISLEEGLRRTYGWIEEQVRQKLEREQAALPVLE